MGGVSLREVDTILGWVPAASWSVYALSQYKTDKKIERSLAQSGWARRSL